MLACWIAHSSSLSFNLERRYKDMSYLLRSYIEHIKFTDLHAADPLPLITIRDIMDTKVLLLLQALLKKKSNTFYEVSPSWDMSLSCSYRHLCGYIKSNEQAHYPPKGWEHDTVSCMQMYASYKCYVEWLMSTLNHAHPFLTIQWHTHGGCLQVQPTSTHKNSQSLSKSHVDSFPREDWE